MVKPIFTKLVGRYLADDEYAKLQSYLSQFPYSEDLIRGSGGVRKLRWATQGRGKRSGLRIIYYIRVTKEHIWMLTLYTKNVKESIPSHTLKQIREAIENE